MMMLTADFTLNKASGKSHEGGNVSAASKSQVGRVGVEPTRPFGQGILSTLYQQSYTVLQVYHTILLLFGALSFLLVPQFDTLRP